MNGSDSPFVQGNSSMHRRNIKGLGFCQRTSLYVTLLCFVVDCTVRADPKSTNGPPQFGPPDTQHSPRFSAENETEYTSIFTELGLKPEDQVRFRSQLVELDRKEIAAEQPMQALLEARIAYDKEVRAVLGEKNYQQYRDYEDSKPARREYELIREYAANSRIFTMDHAFFNTIIELIKNSRATTTETWHGPYDPRPHPVIGREACLTNLNQQMIQYRRASSNLVEALPKSGLPERYKRLLTDYCAHKIAEMDVQATYLCMPEEEWRRRLMEQHEKMLQQRRMNSPAKLTNQIL